MGFRYVIEHMEEDEETQKAIPPWVELEYAHMRILAGPDSEVCFAHLSKSTSDYLSTTFAVKPSPDDSDSGTHLAEASCHTSGVVDLMNRPPNIVPIERVCLLDPKAELALSPEDGDGRFSWFLFGGILGDDPPRDRTAELRVLGFPSRHLGPIQMTTDTALGVTKLVVEDKVPLNEIPYIDYPTITFNPKESVEMPFRYIAIGAEPRLPPGMRELLHEDLNKSFDF